jgi:hypothetical protein
MGLFLDRVLEKFLGHTLSIQTRGHKVVSLVSQYTDDFGGQSFIQQFDNGFSIRFVARRHRASFNMLAGTITQSLDVGKKGLRFHTLSFTA